ncbi:hypothetical protein PDJAM_G00112860 [Pangasius djambal]|uniref:Uncharacterized protein n=1 Tax=Pangasius djambal TaxID=1691987 RepID=A0ACC5Y4C8_9TELE|nr:hypothetical protein [Pangasius djambal]
MCARCCRCCCCHCCHADAARALSTTYRFIHPECAAALALLRSEYYIQREIGSESAANLCCNLRVNASANFIGKTGRPLVCMCACLCVCVCMLS